MATYAKIVDHGQISRVKPMPRHPADIASRTIIKVMATGSKKEGANEEWRKHVVNYHLDRAIRHTITYKLMREHNQQPDGENHLELALTRLAMALSYDH